MPTPTIAESFNTLGTMFGGLFNPRNISPDQFRRLTAPGLSTPTPTRGLANLPANYRGDELQLAARARADQIIRGGSGAGGSVGGGNIGGYVPPSTFNRAPQDRAYQSTKAEVAAMTASDPLFQKYQVADLTKAYNAAKTNEEKQAIGLQIWAQTNSKLAAKLRPGQTGYEEVRQAPGMMASTANFRPMSESVLPTDTDTAGLARPPVFAQPENPLEEVLPPGMLGSSYSGGLQFPSNLVPAGTGQNLPTESFQPTALEVFDPAAIDLDQTMRKLLTQAYKRDLK